MSFLALMEGPSKMRKEREREAEFAKNKRHTLLFLLTSADTPCEETPNTQNKKKHTPNTNKSAPNTTPNLTNQNKRKDRENDKTFEKKAKQKHRVNFI